MPSKPGPSARMCSGVPSAARETCCRASSWPIRGWPVKVAPSRAFAGVNRPALSRAWSRAAPVPWKTLLMNAGPPPSRNCSA